MRAVVQRVTNASISVDGQRISAIGPGLLVLAAVAKGDTEQDARQMAQKLASLRIFTDAGGKMNLNVQQIAGEVLLVSQFTLTGDVRKGNRPAFDNAESPERARALFDYLIEQLAQTSVPVKTGQFQAHMQVSLVNDGPVTILLDSKKLF